MPTVEQSIDVDVPVTTAYNQWTQFELFPHFMEGVEQVQQLDDKRLHWIAEVGGKRKEWDAEIIDQQPDQRIAWRSLKGDTNDGVVTFEPLGDNTTRVMVQLDWEADGLLEKAGSALGADDRRVAMDLERFKHLIEQRSGETGSWRGEIDPR